MDLYDFIWLSVMVLGILYSALTVWFTIGWNSTPSFTPKNTILKTKVSVIIPFFNEQENIAEAINGLSNQNIQTREYEIILVDDNSTDNSAKIAKRKATSSNKIKYLQSKGSGKKAALETGIKEAKGELIVLSDADCIFSKKWLHSIVSYFEENNPSMIISPVVLDNNNNSWFYKFQQLEFAALIGSGAGAVGINHPIMCNGANLAFKKDVYEKLADPFNRKFISGDDVFLLHNFKQQNEKIDFLKSNDATVKTKAATTLLNFFNQRKRWTSKTSGYKDADTFFVAGIVFLTSICPVIIMLLLFVSTFFFKPLLFIFIVKTIADSILFMSISGFFGIKKLIKWIPLFQIFYIFYVSVIGVLIPFSKKS